MKSKEEKQKDRIIPIIKELFVFVRYPKILLLLAVLLIVVMSLCETYFAILIGQTTQSIADGNGLILAAIWLPLTIAAMLRMATTFLYRKLTGDYQAAAQMQFSNYTLQKLLTAKQNWLEKQKSGELTDRTGESLDYAVSLLTDSLPNLVRIILSILVMAVYLFSNNWILAIVYFVFYPVIILLQSNFSKPVRKVTDERFAQSDKCSNLALDALRNHSTIKAYGLEDLMSEEFDNRTKLLRKRFYRFTWVKSLTGFLGDCIAMLPLALVCIGAVVMIQMRMFQFGEFLSFMIVMMNLNSPLFNFGRMMTGIRGNMAGAARVLELWHAPEEDRSQKQGMPSEGSDAIRFERVRFSYNAEDPVLESATFTVKSGEHVALVGESGCGKSTIIRLIGGLYTDYEGHIEIFGQPLGDWTLESLRDQLAYVTQNADLFPVSLYENIAWASREVAAEEVEEVCRSAGIHDFITTLPEGYQTLAGERGMQLSGGQKQRVAIARALLRNPRILILDEATSALDSATEKMVQDELEKLIDGKTAIIVAHRLSSIRNADRILVIDRGAVVEEGSHASLMAEKGLYYTLYKKQQKDAETAGADADQSTVKAV